MCFSSLNAHKLQYLIPPISMYPPIHPSPRESLHTNSYVPPGWQHFSMYEACELYTLLLLQFPKVQLLWYPYFVVTVFMEIQTSRITKYYPLPQYLKYKCIDDLYNFSFYSVQVWMFLMYAQITWTFLCRAWSGINTISVAAVSTISRRLEYLSLSVLKAFTTSSRASAPTSITRPNAINRTW